MTAVKRIFQIQMHKTSSEQPKQIYPEVKGCDGVFFIDKEIKCAAGAKTYYGTAQKQAVTAKTVAARDAVVKSGASAPAVRPIVSRPSLSLQTHMHAGYNARVHRASGES